MRRFILILGLMLVSMLAAAVGRAIEVRTELPLLGQVRDSYFDDEIEAPLELFGDLGLFDLRHGITLDTFFRLEDDLATGDAHQDFYSGVLRVPAVPGVPGQLGLQLGRQIVAQAPGTIYDADAGQVSYNPVGPLALSVFGGQPRYFEPTTGPPVLSDDQQIFGGNVRTTHWQNTRLNFGYLQQQTEGRELRQLVTATGTRVFPQALGMPSVYSSFSFDADHQNIDQVRAGAQAFLQQPRLMLNFESGYYKPQDNSDIVTQNLNRREDSIFQLFSVSEMLQFRGGMRYNFTPTVSAFTDLSYQRYEQLASSFINGYVWGAGLLFLPGGDGLEMAQLQYYGADSGGGTVNGVRGTYENRVYDRLWFRALIDVAYYEKATNQNNTAIASLLGIDYLIVPGLVGELSFEANRNQLFPEDYRFGFFVVYNALYRTEASHVGTAWERATPADRARPWPWGLKQFGPAAWGPVAANANSPLPAPPSAAAAEVKE